MEMLKLYSYFETWNSFTKKLLTAELYQGDITANS